MKRIVMTFSVCCTLGLHMEHKHFVALNPPLLSQGAPDEINMFYKESDVGHTQTAAIAYLPKTLEYGGGRHTSQQTEL